MRLKVSEIVSSIDLYNHTGEYKEGDEWDMMSDFHAPSGMAIIEDEGMVDIIKEMLDFKGAIQSPCKTHRKEKPVIEHVLSFEKYIAEGSNFQKFPPQDPDYDSRPRGWRDEDDDFDEEE